MSGADNDPWISVTNANHYVLDGVPLRVNENYRPKKKSVDPLPDNLRLNVSQSKALNLKYDFETEEGYIHWYEALLKEKAEREEEKQKKLQEAVNKKDTDLKSTERTLPPPETPAQCEPVKPVISSSILLPQRASPVTVVSNQPVRAEYSLKDFENLGDDPFETLELKLINDMDELKDVLASSQTNNLDMKAPEQPKETEQSVDLPPEAIYMNHAPTAENIYENPAELMQGPAGIYENSKPTRPPAPDVNSKKKPPVASPRTASFPSLNSLNSKDLVAHFNNHTVDVNISSSTDQSAQLNVKPKPPVAVKPKPTVASKPKVVNMAGTDRPARPHSADDLDRPKQGGKIHSLATAIAKDLSMNPSKPPAGAPMGFSYMGTNHGSSEDVKNIQWPSLDTPVTPPVATAIPSLPSAQAPSTTHTVVTTQKGDTCNGSSVHNQSDITTLGTTSETQPPKSKMRPNKQPPPRPASLPNSGAQVSDSLLAMGFDRIQINAAIRHLGPDPKLLVEHLCAVQQLTKNGLKWQNAQQGLLMFNSDIDKAEKFAKAYQQLLEFGFGDDIIKDALIRCDVDVDKALDQLVA